MNECTCFRGRSSFRGRGGLGRRSSKRSFHTRYTRYLACTFHHNSSFRRASGYNTTTDRTPKHSRRINRNRDCSPISRDSPCRARGTYKRSRCRLGRYTGRESSQYAFSRTRGAISSTIDVFTLIDDLVFVHSPHIKALQNNISHWHNVRATDDDRTTLNTVVYCPCPI